MQELETAGKTETLPEIYVVFAEAVVVVVALVVVADLSFHPHDWVFAQMHLSDCRKWRQAERQRLKPKLVDVVVAVVVVVVVVVVCCRQRC